jgi:hypothetical protein
MSAASKRYMGRVASVGCVLCAALGKPGTPASVHHVREGQGMAQRAADWLSVALCWDCHQGPNGLHGDRALLRIAKVDELDLLAMTIAALNP